MVQTLFRGMILITFLTAHPIILKVLPKFQHPALFSYELWLSQTERYTHTNIFIYYTNVYIYTNM
jgi:hypothetical protein